MLTQAQVKEILHYEPTTGIFTWLKTRNFLIGREAGTTSPEGYRLISIKKKAYPAHRLAYLYVNGIFPENLIDHKDGDTGNNRWLNLRDATPFQNQQNRKLSSKNSSGFMGVSKSGNRWMSRISVGGTRLLLGCFGTPKEAGEAYKDYARVAFGEFYTERSKSLAD